MTQKKSLLNSLNTTKKAIVASNSEKPNVAAPVSARLRGKVSAKSAARIVGHIKSRVAGRH